MRFKGAYTYNYDAPFFKKTKELNCAVLRLFFKNNSYLLKKRGITLYRQIKDFGDEHITLDYSNIHKLKRGKDFCTSLSYLHFFCQYWGVSLGSMISYDHEERDKMLKEMPV